MADFWYSLKCIRCGACMNTCPVYRRSGGLSYGATYSGPIGVIIDPTFNLRKYSSLPFASTLNGSCTSVCPVQDQHPRADLQVAPDHRRAAPAADVKKEAMQIAGKVLASPKLYRAAVEAAGAGVEHLPRFMMYNRLNAWGRQREVPQAPRIDLPPVVPRASREERRQAMSSRDEILARVRKNQPAPRPLPDVPTFDADVAASLDAFKAGAARAWAASSSTPPPTATSTRSIRALFPDAKVDLLGHARGRRQPPDRRVRAPARPRRCRRRRRARGVRRRGNRIGVAHRTPSSSVNALGFPVATSGRPARSAGDRHEHAPRLPASGIVRRPLCGVHDRTVGDRRYRRRTDPRRPGHPHDDRSFRRAGVAAPRAPLSPQVRRQ